MTRVPDHSLHMFLGATALGPMPKNEAGQYSPYACLKKHRELIYTYLEPKAERTKTSSDTLLPLSRRVK